MFDIGAKGVRQVNAKSPRNHHLWYDKARSPSILFISMFYINRWATDLSSPRAIMFIHCDLVQDHAMPDLYSDRTLLITFLYLGSWVTDLRLLPYNRQDIETLSSRFFADYRFQ